jgi:hypothetical protein
VQGGLNLIAGIRLLDDRDVPVAVDSEQARELIKKHGNNREELDAAARNLRKR